MFHLKEIGLYEHITSYRMADLVELSLFPGGACSSAAFILISLLLLWYSPHEPHGLMSCCLVKTGELGPTFLHSCYWWCVQEQSLCGNKAFPLSSPAHHHGGPHGVREEGKRRREPKAQHFKCLPFGPSGQIFICAGPSGPKLGEWRFWTLSRTGNNSCCGQTIWPPAWGSRRSCQGPPVRRAPQLHLWPPIMFSVWIKLQHRRFRKVWWRRRK